MSLLSAGALVVFLLPLAYSPGPGNIFFAALGARAGVRGAVPALAGYHLAGWVVTVAIGLSAGLTLLRDPTVSLILGLLGGAYMLWLGITSLIVSWRTSSAHVTSAGPAEERPSTPVRVPGFRSGLWLLVLNPQAFVIIAVMFTAFLNPRTSTTSDVVRISTIFILNNLVAFVIWAGLGQVLSALLSTSRQRVRVDQAFGLGLVGVGVWLLITAW